MRVIDDQVRGVPCVWVDAELIGEHVHVEVQTGTQYGQPEMPTYREYRAGHANDAGSAGNLILRRDQWPRFIRALAVGGAVSTGLRVIWHAKNLDPRYLWNGLSCDPCVVGTKEPVPWDYS